MSAGESGGGVGESRPAKRPATASASSWRISLAAVVGEARASLRGASSTASGRAGTARRAGPSRRGAGRATVVAPASRPTRPSQCSRRPPSTPTSRPAAVVDLAQRGEHGGAGVTVHREDRAEVLEDDDPAARRSRAAGRRSRRPRRLSAGCPESSAASVSVATTWTPSSASSRSAPPSSLSRRRRRGSARSGRSSRRGWPRWRRR